MKETFGSNTIKYEVFRIKDYYILYTTGKRLDAYNYFEDNNKIEEPLGLRKVTTTMEVEILE